MEATVDSALQLGLHWGIKLLMATLILIAGWLIGGFADRLISSIRRFDRTVVNFLGGCARYAVVGFAIVTILAELGVQTASLVAVLGAAGLAIGLALQGTLSNVAAGVMLLVLRPFNVGDTITCGPVSGTVRSLGLFGTELATADNVYIFAPNSTLWNTNIQNFSRNRDRRQDIVVSIGYDDDIDRAMKVLAAVVETDPRVLKTPAEKAPQIVVETLADYAVNVTVRLWTQTADYGAVRSDLIKLFKETLDREHFTISFPTRALQLTNGKAEPDRSGKRPARRKAG